MTTFAAAIAGDDGDVQRAGHGCAGWPTASDTAPTAFAEATITVNPAPLVNQARPSRPVVIAQDDHAAGGRDSSPAR
ncbi:MAG: hypothetical protein U0Q55_15045 [Vicinamibacterales bacterium]